MFSPVCGRYTSRMKLNHSLFALALVCACANASAQWLWVGKDGQKVFSDRAPPPDVLEKDILKRPAGRPLSPAATQQAADAAAATSANAIASPAAAPNKDAGTDKELEAKKKQAAEAEANKRKEEESKITKAKIENCARAKQAKATFDSGIRISRTNAAGEREVMDDNARAAEQKRIEGIMAADCK
jgi:hypothetical protein